MVAAASSLPIPSADLGDILPAAPDAGSGAIGRKPGYVKDNMIELLKEYFKAIMEDQLFFKSNMAKCENYVGFVIRAYVAQDKIDKNWLDRLNVLHEKYGKLYGDEDIMDREEWYERREFIGEFLATIDLLLYMQNPPPKVPHHYLACNKYFGMLGQLHPIGGNGIMLGVKDAGKSNMIAYLVTELAQDSRYAVATNLQLDMDAIRADFGKPAANSVTYVETYSQLLEAIGRNMIAEETFVMSRKGLRPRIMVIYQDEMDSTLSTAYASGSPIKNWQGLSFQLRKLLCCWWGIYHHEENIPSVVKQETTMYIYKGMYIDDKGVRKPLEIGTPRWKGAVIKLHDEYMPDCGQIPDTTKYHFDYTSALRLSDFPTTELLTHLSSNFTNDWVKLGHLILEFLDITRNPWDEPEAPKVAHLVQFDPDTIKPRVSLDKILRYFYSYPMDLLEKQLKHLKLTKGRPFDESEYEQLREAGFTKRVCAVLYRKGRSRLPHLSGIDPPSGSKETDL